MCKLNEQLTDTEHLLRSNRIMSGGNEDGEELKAIKVNEQQGFNLGTNP